MVGLDVNPGMLAVAQRREPGITWREAPAESIPYDDGSFDAVVSQFGLIHTVHFPVFFQDPRGALREMWRVLAPGGALAVAVWDTLENTPAYAGEANLLSRMAGEKVAGVLRAPFSLGEPARLRKLFAGAGIPSPALSTQQGRARFPSLRAMLDADIKAWLPLAGVVLNEEQTEAIVAEAERSLGEYVKSDGTVEFATPAHIVTASKA